MSFQSTPMGQSLPHEQAQRLLQALPLMLVVELLAACGLGWLYQAGPAPRNILYIWLGAAVLLAAWRLKLLFHYRDQLAHPHADSSLPTRYLLAMVFAGAAIFAGAAFLFVLPSNLPSTPDLQVLTYDVILLVLVFIGTASYAASLGATTGYVLIVMGPSCALMVWHDLRGPQPWIAVLMPSLMVTAIVAGRRMHTLIMRSLRTELRNRSLIQFLESARNDAEQLSEKLAREVFDRREARQRLQEAKERLESMVGERTQALEQANKRLASTSQRLQLALDASRIAMWGWDIENGTGFQANFKELLGQEPEDEHHLHAQLQRLTHTEDLALVRDALVQHLKGETRYFQCTYRMWHGDGTWHWIEDHGQVVARDASQRATRMIGTRRDITETKRADEQRRLAATVFENASEGIFICDTEFRFLAVNDSFTRITGFTEADVIGKPLPRPTEEADRLFFDEIFNSLHTEGLWQGELAGTRKNGESFPEWLQINAVYDERRQLTHYVCMLSDLTERKQGEERVQFLSNHDRLTGLANRNQFREALQRELTIARLKHSKVALLYMDLDRFKPINDSLGHEIGDAVLKLCAQRLLECGPTDDQLARIDGDEFTILLPYDEIGEVDELCHKIINTIKQPFTLHGHELLLGTSIGISLYPDNAKDTRTMINQADIAMHQAKHMGGNTSQYYRSDMRSATVEQLALETSLRKALSKNEFVLYYQPKLDLRDGVIRSCEALVRWQHPTMGLLMPGTFIPLAEEAGLITEIGEWVLNEACRQTAAWHQRGVGTITTSVNFSVQQFRSTDIVGLVNSALKASHLSPRQLEMELTESLLMDDFEVNLDTLRRVRELGVGLSLDDFGTGYSSLSYLKRFPIDELKIDRAFVMDLATNDSDAAIVQAIITMAQSLNLRVVAEGIEDQAQMDKLREMGCDAIQGYLVSKPVPAAEMEVLLFQQSYRFNQN